MSKVTIKPTAHQEPATEALPDNVLIDSTGRRLVLEDPDFLTESRIMRALGEASTNTAYVLGYVMPAVRVVQIDDVRTPYPTTLQQIEGAINRLGREGTSAVLAYDAKKLAEAKEAAEQAQVDALKNS